MKTQTTKNQHFLFGILASISAAFIAFSDYLLEYTGEAAQGLTFIDPAWLNMAPWRFPLSINICVFLIPFYLLGFWAIRCQLAATHPKQANWFFGLSAYGIIMGASFVHSVLNYFPMIYQKLAGAGQQTLAEETIMDITNAILPAFIVHYVLSWVVPQILLFILIIRGKTIYNRWTAFLNPFVFLIVGSVGSFLAPKALQVVYVGIINKGNVAIFILATVYALRTGYIANKPKVKPA